MSEKGGFTKQMEQRIQDRKTEDLTILHNCTAAYIYHPVGASLDEIEPFTTELTQVVDKMKEELVNEKRILEGTDVPEYNQNELKIVQVSEEQWKNALQSGSLTIDPTHASTLVSDTSLSFVELSNLDCPNGCLPELYMKLSTNSCVAKSGECGTEIDVTNECCECTVPTISEPMDGTQSETK